MHRKALSRGRTAAEGQCATSPKQAHDMSELVLKVSDYVQDLGERSVLLRGENFGLTLRKCKLATFLLSNVGRIAFVICWPRGRWEEGMRSHRKSSTRPYFEFAENSSVDSSSIKPAHHCMRVILPVRLLYSSH